MRNNLMETDGSLMTATPLFPQLRSLTGFEFGEYNRTFLQRTAEEALNDAVDYGVRIIPATVAPGQEYWYVIGIHHLTPAENQGKHHTFLDILDRTGQRVHNPALQVEWHWEGQQPPKPHRRKPLINQVMNQRPTSIFTWASMCALPSPVMAAPVMWWRTCIPIIPISLVYTVRLRV